MMVMLLEERARAGLMDSALVWGLRIISSSLGGSNTVIRLLELMLRHILENKYIVMIKLLK